MFSSEMSDWEGGYTVAATGMPNVGLESRGEEKNESLRSEAGKH